MHDEEGRGGGVAVRNIVVLVVVAFVVALGVVVGTRLSSDAIAVLIGVIAGVAASIPTALLLIAVTRRREEPEEPEHYRRQESRQPAPPVIVVAPGSVPQVLSQYGDAYPSPQLPAGRRARQFRVMGLDEGDMEPLETEVGASAWPR